MRAIQGVICDMDGTLVDSEGLHLEAWNLMLESCGRRAPYPHWSDDCIGLPDQAALDKVLALFPDLAGTPDLLQCKQRFFRQLVAERGTGLTTPAIREKLEQLRDAGIGLAVGTNSNTPNTQATLGAAGLLDMFPVIVTASMVERGKPQPDIYLKAARDLGLDPADCAVLEDSTAGLTAARAAGCLVLGVATTWPAEKLSPVDLIFADTAEALEWTLAERCSRT